MPAFVGRRHLRAYFEEPFTKEDQAHSSLITRHPSASLYDRFFAKALPEVAVVAAHKNVYLPDGEPEAVLRYALKDTSRKVLKLALQKNDEACWKVSFALDHALDVLAMKRLIMVSKTVCKMPLPGDGALVMEAEASLKRRFANDTKPTRAIWRDPVEEVADYGRGLSLHARSLLIAREILCLLYGGYPDGALSRWRSPHELTVTAVFLKTQEQEVSHRYLASFPFASLRAARQLNEYAERANMKPFTGPEIKVMETQCDAFEARLGKEMHNEYGWASAALKNPKPNFAQLEKAVSLDHWRPRYRWASQHTHGGYRPALSMLGTAESTQPVHLVLPTRST